MKLSAYCSFLVLSIFSLQLRARTSSSQRLYTRCVDKNWNCFQWARMGQCTRNPTYMKPNCPKSCSLCCQDSRFECNGWARQGECSRNPTYMKSNCKKSCGLCSGVQTPGWSSWTKWSVCSRTCGGGSRKRTRNCSNPAPQNGDRTCQGPNEQTVTCNSRPCPVCKDNNIIQCPHWAKIGECTRNPAYMRTSCRKSCRVCVEKVDGSWGAWDNWSVCTRSCGGGIRKRTRTCSNPAPKHGGRTCPGPKEQIQSCNMKQCPVAGQWGAWSKWTVCSKSCDIGVSQRTRYCNNPEPQNGGRTCVGKGQETRRCSLRTCPRATTSAAPTTSHPLICGRPKRSRIVGGEVASNRDWPWQVGLQTEDDDFIFCGGSLINREWVLTAAHCIYRNNPSRQGCVPPFPGLRVILGEFDVENIDGHEVQKTISEVCMHHAYDHSIYNNDIALLRFSTPLPGFNETMSPVCLPTASSSFPPGTTCSVTGWGKTSQSGPGVSKQLRVAHVPIINHATCREQYWNRTGDIVTDKMICAGYQEGKVDSCKGDSGGPFVCKEGGRHILVGATSWGVGCAQPGQPGVYTDIKDFLGWIQDLISSNPEP